eukprot:NODE_15236_length_1061_cov_7.375803.p1 GENE.NODE_15236_length_1061_cov_7.375803~~NODE_15236_length_1061_cov_7.375803.p1  ORF type:complete len:262 (-),score=57.35 NODE_15236_length_1061_cov_7.375803:209-994(-)
MSQTARPAAGPGQDITPSDLRTRWASIQSKVDVLGFYGHSEDAGPRAIFSNFYDQSRCPFEFEVPVELFAFEVRPADRRVMCACSEMAIMLCKAAVMGDMGRYRHISTMCGARPGAIKKQGRLVARFDDELWQRVVCSIAYEIVYQKFKKTPELQPVLLETGNKLMAEATRSDANWGIGIGIGRPGMDTPSAWKGSNILGWALMEVREALRRETADEGGSAAAATGAGGAGAAAPPPTRARRWHGHTADGSDATAAPPRTA